jgi:hypothetical protein
MPRRRLRRLAGPENAAPHPCATAFGMNTAAFCRYFATLPAPVSHRNPQVPRHQLPRAVEAVQCRAVQSNCLAVDFESAVARQVAALFRMVATVCAFIATS